MAYLINEDLPTDGLIVDVILKNEVTGAVALTVTKINGSTGVAKTFSRTYADALVYLTKQQNE